MMKFSEGPAAPAKEPTFPRRAFFNEPAPDDTETPLETFVELVDELAATEIPDPAPPGAEPEPPTADIRRMLEGTQGKNYYELFGMTVETFTPARLRDRYFHYTGQFNPNLLMRLSGEEALQAQEILDRITTAYNTLADTVKRAGYDDLLRQGRNESGQLAPDRIQAQVQARAGLLHLDRKDWERAEQALQEACNLEPFNGEWMAHLAWALYRNPISASSRARRDKARQTVNRALGLERTAHGHAYKGWMMLDADQTLEAGDEFVQALRFDARLELAREGQKILEKRQDQERRGMFRRMFGIR
jgi:tetratricopeptide (TPR) repeat protein